jgi:magnesium-transporting ATPase (P-type)
MAAGKTLYKPMGAPTEVSLLTLGQKAGLDQKQLQQSKPRVSSIPFESEHKVCAKWGCAAHWYCCLCE